MGICKDHLGAGAEPAAGTSEPRCDPRGMRGRHTRISAGTVRFLSDPCWSEAPGSAGGKRRRGADRRDDICDGADGVGCGAKSSSKPVWSAVEGGRRSGVGFQLADNRHAEEEAAMSNAPQEPTGSHASTHAGPDCAGIPDRKPTPMRWSKGPASGPAAKHATHTSSRLSCLTSSSSPPPPSAAAQSTGAASAAPSTATSPSTG
jgi:hypothetical protein